MLGSGACDASCHTPLAGGVACLALTAVVAWAVRTHGAPAELAVRVPSPLGTGLRSTSIALLPAQVRNKGSLQPQAEPHWMWRNSAVVDPTGLPSSSPGPYWVWGAGLLAVVGPLLVSLLAWTRHAKRPGVLQPLLNLPTPASSPRWCGLLGETKQPSPVMAERLQATQRQMLASLVAVREALREELRRTPDATVQRLAGGWESTLPEELAALLATLPLGDAQPSAARQQYIARIREVARSRPVLLIAHQHFWQALADQLLAILGAAGSPERQQRIRMRMQLSAASITLEDRLAQVPTLSATEVASIVNENDHVYDLNLKLLTECQDPALLALYNDQLRALQDRVLWRALAAQGVREEGPPPPLGPTEEEQAVAAAEAEKEQALLRQIDAEIRELTGQGFDALLSPGKVVRLEKELLQLREELAQCGDPERRAELQRTIAKKADESLLEKRSVMKTWLGTVFRVQAAISAVASGLLAANHFPGIAEVDLPIRALGFWSWWLFTIPSLRAIKPLQPQEKSALNWAFLGTLFASLLIPAATRDTGAIWAADAAIVAGCYVVAYARGEEEKQAPPAAPEAAPAGPPNPVFDSLRKFGAFAATALDFGSGRERGTVEAERKTGLEKELERRLREKVEKLKD